MDVAVTELLIMKNATAKPWRCPTSKADAQRTSAHFKTCGQADVRGYRTQQEKENEEAWLMLSAHLAL